MKQVYQPKIVWEPLPGSQTLALDSRCHITFYCGTRGPGKTDCQLMSFRKEVGLGYGKFWRGIILDCEYKNLDDVVSKSKRWFPEFQDGARFNSSQGDLKWVWPTGEELLFRAAAELKDYDKYHGHEYPFIGWNELTKHANSKLFQKMMSTNRSSFKSQNSVLPPIPLRTFVTTNPHGVGHGWCKRRFIDKAPYGVPVREKFKVEKPGSRGTFVEVERSQVAIFGSWVENKFLDPEYIAALMQETDDAVKRAWLTGDWNIVAGGAFDDLWKPNVHVLPRFAIPKGWSLHRAYDHGSSHPFAVGFYAVANGEEATIVIGDEEFSWCPPRRTIVKLGEWYGCKRDEDGTTNEGLRMAISEIAAGILEREEQWLDEGWIQTKFWPGPADTQIWDKPRIEHESIADAFSDHGVEWTRANKSPGSRKQGLLLVRQRLYNALHQNRRPGLYFMDNCRDNIATIPVLPRDPDDLEDVDTNAEDHTYDETRYFVGSVDHLAGQQGSVHFN